MKRDLQPTRLAFTLVEMLVVIAIMGILVALLVPGVQASRERARRSQCLNNLIRLSLGLQQYESAFAHLPAGVDDPGGAIVNVEQGKHLGWIASVLPFVDQQNTFAAIDFEKGAYDPANAAARNVKLVLLICPTSGDPMYSRGVSGYAGCHHEVEAPIAVDNNGVLFQNSAVRFDQIVDGRSHTIFLGEKLFSADPLRASAVPFPLYVKRVLTADDEPLEYYDETTGETRRRAPAPPIVQDPDFAPMYAFLELGWLSGTRSTLRNTGTPINRTGGTLDGVLPRAPPPPGSNVAGWVGGFESLHPTGAQFAFGDGSVKFLSQSISTTVYQQLGHRADGKLLADDAY